MLGNSEDTMTVTESARSVRRVQKPCAFVQFSVAQHSVSVEHLVEARQTATCDIYTFRLLLYPSKFSCQLFCTCLVVVMIIIRIPNELNRIELR